MTENPKWMKKEEKWIAGRKHPEICRIKTRTHDTDTHREGNKEVKKKRGGEGVRVQESEQGCLGKKGNRPDGEGNEAVVKKVLRK